MILFSACFVISRVITKHAGNFIKIFSVSRFRFYTTKVHETKVNDWKFVLSFFQKYGQRKYRFDSRFQQKHKEHIWDVLPGKNR